MKRWTAALVLMALAPGARAITDEEVFRTFRFNFVNPGGRAGAMGGAFIGIADDATAAAANPAGLTNLLAPELFTELRLQDPKATVLSGVVRDPRGGPDPVLTTSSGDPESNAFPSFISFVKPFEHWTFGFSRQEVLNARMDASNLFTDAPKVPTTEIVRTTGRLDALVEHYNATAAFTAGEKLGFGVTVTYARIDLESSSANEFNYGSGLTDDYATVVDDADEDFTASAGIIWHPHEKLDVGFTYRRGPRFELTERIVDTRPPGNFPSGPLLADFLGNRSLRTAPGAPYGIAPQTFDDPMEFANVFKIPDQAGVGIGWQPNDHWTIAADAVWVKFSDLEEGFVGNVNALTFPGDPYTCDFSSPQPDGTFPCDYQTPYATYRIDDHVVYHAGIEYAWNIKEKLPFLVRAGFYTDPNVRLTADFPAGGVFIADEPTFRRGNATMHYTIGVGFLAQQKLQMDFAADISNVSYEYVTSVIYHF